jgi:DNA adenine methylase
MLASRILPYLSPHLTYIEPFAGGLALLLHRDGDGVNEIVNDINGDLMNFWRVLRDEESFERFRRMADATPFCEAIFREAKASLEAGIADAVERAYAFFVVMRQSHAGRGKDFAALTTRRLRRGRNEQTSAWTTCVDGLPEIHQRLRRVAILNRDAIDVIRGHDGPEVLFYCDPPYLAETRTAKKVYHYEMDREDHERLLAILLTVKGKVMLSGYPNPLYDESLAVAGWRVVDLQASNHAAGGKAKRVMTERLWLND